MRADATDDVAVSSVMFTVNGVGGLRRYFRAVRSAVDRAARAGQPMVLGAIAADFGGNSASAPTVAVDVIPDPLTTVVGRVVDRDGAPVNGATVTLFTLTTTTAGDGTFTLGGVPTVQGNLIVTASAIIDGRTVRGRSAATVPVPAGTTDRRHDHAPGRTNRPAPLRLC